MYIALDYTKIWFQEKLSLLNCFSFVKLKPWGALKPRRCLTRNLRHILMISTLKDYQRTFLLEVPHGTEFQGWKKSFKWAIELSLLLKGKIIIYRNRFNAVCKKRLISWKLGFCSLLVFRIKVLHFDSFTEQMFI